MLHSIAYKLRFLVDNVNVVYMTHWELYYEYFHIDDFREAGGGLSSVQEEVTLTHCATTCCVCFFPVMAHLPDVILGLWLHPRFHL